MSNHSPIPWNISRHGTPEHSPQFGLYSGDGRNPDIVIVTGPNAKADAEFIKRAVENHEKLIDVLERVTQFMENAVTDSHEENRNHYLKLSRDAVREANYG